MTFSRPAWFWLLVVAVGLFSFGCDEATIDATPEPVPVRFVFGMRSDPSGAQNFSAATTDSDVIAQARLQLNVPREQRTLIIIGPIARGAEGNVPWSWHFVESAWELDETAIEVCDATPTYVEEHLDDWLKSPITFCPWDSILLSEDR